MISPEDLAMLQQLGKEAKEVPNFYPGDFLNLIKGVDFHVLYDICGKDDNTIDIKEENLLVWFLYKFEPRLHGDPALGEEALNIIFDSYFS